ncbi:MAG: DUF2752 domain-containing protein [Firmicutes bacterium]|nr:DUF2752 domain-containing protein [Bacillota bacterium]
MKKYLPRIAVLAAPAAAILLCAVFAQKLIALGESFPKCLSRTLFDIWCPACGNTRAVQCLLRLDILGSLRYNITPAVLLTVAGLFWCELIFRTFGRTVRLYPRKPLFSYLLTGFMLLYYIVRNFIPFLMPA